MRPRHPASIPFCAPGGMADERPWGPARIESALHIVDAPPWSPAGRARSRGGFGILQGLAWAQWVCSAMRSSTTRTRVLLAALVVGPLRGLAVLMSTYSGRMIRWSLDRGYS